jgi:hypothetical protein
MIRMPSAEKLLQNSSTPKHCASAQHFFWGTARQTSALAEAAKDMAIFFSPFYL